ncbi:hypothetical protein QBC39DRAFT_114962 [Podospora conica]|nr:hypothetical protein QBC39DRAFT_114962 [Schizothecium conicum]
MVSPLEGQPGLRRSSRLQALSSRDSPRMTPRRLISVSVDPSALRAIVGTKAAWQYSTFPSFPKLPAELQVMIWEYAVGEGPRMFIVPPLWAGPMVKRLPQESKNAGRWSVAALLSTCGLSRSMASQVWGVNVGQISSPGTLATLTSRHHSATYLGDLATDVFYWRYSWSDMFRWMAQDTQISTIGVRYHPWAEGNCGDYYCSWRWRNEPSADCEACSERLSSMLTFVSHCVAGSGLRQFAMVVEDSGIVLTSKGSAKGPRLVCTTLKNDDFCEIPDGTRFYDVTDELADAEGTKDFKAKNFKAKQAMMTQLKGANRVLKMVENGWRSSSTRKKAPLAFRLFVGVKRSQY